MAEKQSDQIDGGRQQLSDTSITRVESNDKELGGKGGETQGLEVQEQQKSDEKDNNSRTIKI